MTHGQPAALLARWPGAIAIVSIAQLLGTSLWFSANAAFDHGFAQAGAATPITVLSRAIARRRHVHTAARSRSRRREAR